MSKWRLFETAPKDGTWIIGLMNDRIHTRKISWGIDRTGEEGWCGVLSPLTGDGLWLAWMPFPEAAPYKEPRLR